MVEEPPIDVTNIASLCLKPVIIIAFDITYPQCQLKCVSEKCNQILTVKGWHDKYRCIHGPKCGFFALQKVYSCASCKTSVTSLEILKGPKVPPYVRLRYPLVSAGETLWFHSDLANSVLNDTLTGKTFDEMCEGIKSNRVEMYTKHCAMFLSSASLCPRITFGDVNSTMTSALAPQSLPFSEFEDEFGYNELLSPTPNTLIDFFCSHAGSF